MSQLVCFSYNEIQEGILWIERQIPRCCWGALGGLFYAERLVVDERVDFRSGLVSNAHVRWRRLSRLNAVADGAHPIARNVLERCQDVLVVLFLKPGFGKGVRDRYTQLPIFKGGNKRVLKPGCEVS